MIAFYFLPTAQVICVCLNSGELSSRQRFRSLHPSILWLCQGWQLGASTSRADREESPLISQPTWPRNGSPHFNSHCLSEWSYPVIRQLENRIPSKAGSSQLYPLLQAKIRQELWKAVSCVSLNIYLQSPIISSYTQNKLSVTQRDCLKFRVSRLCIVSSSGLKTNPLIVQPPETITGVICASPQPTY